MFSDRQKSFIKYSDSFLNIADGAVRSGKTHASLRRLSQFARSDVVGDMAVFGKTERTVKRNIVYPLGEMLPKKAVRYVQGSGELYVWGRRFWIVGANDARAEEKVRGMTLAGAYANEITLYPSDVVSQLIDRCSVDGSQIFADCNPDSPHHYLNKDYLAAGLPKTDLKRWRFTLEDNPALSEDYKARLHRLHPPGTLWHRRMVLGEWVAAEGAIYEQWDEAVHVVDEMPGKPERVVIGVDVGTQNATVFLAAGKVGRTWYVFDEYHHSGRDSGRQKTNGEYAKDFVRFVERIGYTPSSVEVDPSAADFKLELRNHGAKRVRDADNSVLEGIRTVSTALTDGTLKICKRCEHLRSEFPSYVWDTKKQEKGEDAPMKGAGIEDHALDAARYLSMRIFSGGQTALRLVR